MVDDAHWLDAASLDALLFAARRLPGLRVALLMALRRGEPDRIGDAIPVLDVRGLDPAAAQALLAASSRRLAPAVSQALVHQTAGNPLALVEIPKLLTAAQRAGSAPWTTCWSRGRRFSVPPTTSPRPRSGVVHTPPWRRAALTDEQAASRRVFHLAAAVPRSSSTSPARSSTSFEMRSTAGR
jgi:hypothetical protein